MNSRIETLAKSFANITPESHAAKVEQYRTIADKADQEDKHVYEELDVLGLDEMYKGGGGLVGTFLGLFGLASLPNFEIADSLKVAAAIGLYELVKKSAKLAIRSVDTSSAIEQVISENWGRGNLNAK